MVTKTEWQTGRIPRWASLLVYVLLSLLMTWPLAQNPSTYFASTDPDLFNVYWGNWWVRQALASGQNPYTTNHLIYPVGFNLATFAFSPLLALLSIPLSWIASPIVAYNLLMWLTIVLSCVAMHQLVRYLTGSDWAALAAAITFAFAPRLVAERASHLNMAFVVWLPWAALLLTRLMREAKIRDAILLAVVVGLSFLTRPQVGALTLLFSGVYFLGLALADRKRWHRLAPLRLLLAALLALVFLSPLLYLIWQALQQPGGESLLRWGAGEVQTDLLAYVLPPPKHPLFGSWTEPFYYGTFVINRRYWAYLGFVPLLLSIYAAISRPRKALPWLLAGLLFLFLALGPYLRLNGRVYPAIKLPYSLAPGLFSAIGFDTPNRFNLAVMTAVSVLVGLACAQLAARTKRSWLPAVAALLILGEYLVAPVTLWDGPGRSPFYDQMAADGEEYAIVDLPLTREAGEVHRYYQTIHHKPIVGGWDHRVPPSAFDFIDSNPLLAAWRGVDLAGVTLDQALDGLSEANVRYIVLHKGQLGSLPDQMNGLLSALKPVYEDDTLYVLPVKAASPDSYQVVHWFGEQTGLIRPTLSLAGASNGGDPQLLLHLCWWLGPESGGAGAYQVDLTAPSGAPVARQTPSLPPGSEDLVCQRLPLELTPPFDAGQFTLSITALSGDEPVDAYSTEMPLHALQEPAGTPFPAMGSPSGATFEAPFELLGHHLAGGHGYLWLDLYWRGPEEQFELYRLSLNLLDQKTGQVVASATQDISPALGWRNGDLLQERRALWINDVPQGQYSLGVALIHREKPDERIEAFDAQTGEPWPQAMLLLDAPVLILPTDLRESPVDRKGRILAYSRATGAGLEPEQPASASFAEIAELTGYRVVPKEAKVGEDLEITLYWQATNQQPIPNDYTVFVHLLDQSGQLIAQHDGEPAAGRRPTRTWRQGDLIVDPHSLQWQTEAYRGPATLAVGLYNLETLERLPAYGPDGERLADDRVILREIQVR